ncbi:MAG: queuosine precursor transporter [Ruminococcus sp.]|jgi:uncharacterized integral membrane protein (TIGR00697 family)|nr:queuosine precursor transporter [Ruminococcus sp.]
MSDNVFNTLLFFVTLVLYLGAPVAAYKLFGKSGLYVWTAFSVVIANIEALKMVTMFGLPLSLGNALYASSFLTTDILSENHSKQDATKAVNIGLFVTIVWIIASQLIILFRPNEFDFVQPAFHDVFGLVPRISIASIITYAVTQRIDILLYHFFWKKTGNNKKFLWLRNNCSTAISQGFDTLIFTLVAFAGVYEWSYVWILCGTSYVVKFVVTVCDTPFVYISRKIANATTKAKA